MIILAIDPGPVTCGVVELNTSRWRLSLAEGAATVQRALDLVATAPERGVGAIAIERVKAGQFAGDSYLQTSEVVGRLQERGIVAGFAPALMYRTDILRWLDLLGVKGTRDAAVNRELVRRYGGATKAQVKGTRSNPGPLFGISHHGWQALGVAEAYAESQGLRKQ